MGQPYWNYIEGGKRRRGSFPEESCYRSLVEVVGSLASPEGNT